MSVRAHVISEGDFYLSTVEIGGNRYMRAVFMNPGTSMEDVRRLIDTVRKAAARSASEESR
jgi:hypothetical protein